MILKPNPSPFSETKFSMKSVDVQLHCMEAWCIFFEQVVSLGKIILPALHVKQVLLPAQWENGTLSLSSLFSKNKSGTFCLVVGGSVNIKFLHGKSPAIAKCRVKLVIGKDELLS